MFGFTGELGNILGPHNDTGGICVLHRGWIFTLSMSAVFSGTRAAFVRRSGSSGGTVGKQSSTEVYIGNVDFLWPGFLTLLQICCATSGRSLYSPECFFSLLFIRVILPGGNCIKPSVVQHQVVQAAGVSQNIHHTNNDRKESTHQKYFLTF